MENFFNTLQGSNLFTGDFNAWHRSWGSTTCNRKGKIISKYINEHNLFLLNDGSPTHLSTHSTFTHVDLSFCTSDLGPITSWEIISDLHGSDHHPILLKLSALNQPNKILSPPKFKLKLANWEKYKILATRQSNKIPISNNTNKESSNIQKIILQAANESIPQTKIKTKNITVPWWNDTLKNLRAQK